MPFLLPASVLRALRVSVVLPTPVGGVPALLALLTSATPAQEPSPSSPLVHAGTIELPGVEGRIDHLAVDLARERLVVAALGNGSVEVVDLAAGRRTRSLKVPPEPQGILCLPRQDRIVVACGGSGTCEIFDGATLEPRKSLAVGDDADNLRCDPSQSRVYVAFEGGLGIVDADTWTVLGRVPLDGHPEGFQLGPEGRAYVNLPGRRQVVVVDLEKAVVAGHWSIDEAGANYPMALDAGGGAASGEPLVLLGCRSPATLVLRARGGEPRGTLALSGDVDDLFVDSARGRVYAACGEGFVDVFEHGPDGLRPRTRIATAPGARTGLFVPERGRLYVAAPRRGSAAARIEVLEVRD